MVLTWRKFADGLYSGSYFVSKSKLMGWISRFEYLFPSSGGARLRSTEPGRSRLLSNFRNDRVEALPGPVVYLRLLEVPVPVIYGRSADENPFASGRRESKPMPIDES